MVEERKLLPPGRREEEKGRVPTGVIVVLGAASAAAIGIGLWLLTRRPEEPEPPEPGRANLYGVVIDTQTKKGIPGAMVTLASIVIYTDSSGAYIHEDIMPGSYTVSFDAEGYESKQLSIYIDEGNNELDVELIPVGLKAEFHCGVWDSVTHEAVVNALVRLDGPETREQRVNQWGDASFYDLPAGDYTITISMTDYRTLQEAISIPPGRTELEFYLVYEEPPEMEDIDVRWLVVEPEVAFVGKNILARAQVLNLSTQERDATIICNIDGQSLSQVVHLMPSGENGCWEVVVFRFSIDTPGNYVVSVGDKSQPITVAAVITGLWNPYTGEGPFDSDGLIDSIDAGPGSPGRYSVYTDDGQRRSVSSTWSYFYNPVCVQQKGFYYYVRSGHPPEHAIINPWLTCRILYPDGYDTNALRSLYIFEYLLDRYGEGIFAEDHIPFEDETVPIREITQEQYNQMKADFARMYH